MKSISVLCSITFNSLWRNIALIIGSLLCSQTLININFKILLMLFLTWKTSHTNIIWKRCFLNLCKASFFIFLVNTKSLLHSVHPFTITFIIATWWYELPFSHKVFSWRDVLCLFFLTCWGNLKHFGITGFGGVTKPRSFFSENMLMQMYTLSFTYSFKEKCSRIREETWSIG